MYGSEMNIFKCKRTRCAIKLKLAIVVHKAFATKAVRWRRRNRREGGDEKKVTKVAMRRMDKGGYDKEAKTRWRQRW